MKQVEAQGLVFESTTEARIASELAIQLMGEDVLTGMGLEPPLPPSQRRIGPVDAINRRIEDRLGTSKPQEYVIADDDKAQLVLKVLGLASMPRNILMPPRMTSVFRRKSYMAKRLRRLFFEQRSENSETD